MKQSIVAMAALVVVGAASAQSAPQSSVTLFGIVDAAVAYGNGDTSSKTRIVNSGYKQSQLGMRGEKNLANDMKISFWLEAGLNNDDGSFSATNSNNQAVTPLASPGTQGLTFNRRATISLAGNFGEVRAGRDYVPQYLNNAAFDPFANLGVGASRAIIGSLGAVGATTVYSSNGVSYYTPSMSGFKVQVQTYLGENASTAAADVGTGTGLRASYAGGPFSFGLAYGKTITGVGTDVQSTNLGLAYDFGAVKLMGAVTKDARTNIADVNGYQVGVRVPVGAADALRASVSGSDNGTTKVQQFAIGYVWSLDKDADIYVTYATLNNSGGGAAALNGATTSVNGSSSGVDIGFRYSF